MSAPPVTICVLAFGDHAELVRRCIGSIIEHCQRSRYRLVVGANAVGDDTRRYLDELEAGGAIDRLVSSDENINKCPMMRRMFEDIDTEYIWWFDDDSFVESPRALDTYLAAARSAPERVVMWGKVLVNLCEPGWRTRRTVRRPVRAQRELVRRADPAVVEVWREG